MFIRKPNTDASEIATRSAGKFSIFIQIVIAILGFGVGIFLSVKFVSAPSVSISGWRISPLVGTIAADPYTRAAIAKSGLLALTRKEAIYLSAESDTKTGQKLVENCDYLVEGSKLPARWWSITLYADDDFLAQNDDGHPSFDATKIGQNPTFKVTISQNKPATGDWISNKNSGNFDLTLRLYNPEPIALEDTDSLNLPTITKISCRG
jgi:hypothetical protein